MKTTTTIDRKELSRALVMAARVAPKKTPNPILKQVLLESDGKGKLTVTATNLELYGRAVLETVEYGAEWSALVNAKEARDTLKHTKGTTVELSIVSERNLLITPKSGPTAVLIGDLPDMFPAFPRMPSDATRFETNAPDFRRMIQEVRYAAAREISRYMINGVHVSVVDNALRLVATDGRRLAVSESHVFASDVSLAETVPLATMDTLRMSIGKRDTLLSVSFGNPTSAGDATLVRFAVGDTVLISQLYESKFPDYACVMPKTADVSVTVNRSELVSALTQLRTYEASDLPLVSFDVCPDRLSLAIESADKGSGSATLQPTGKGTGTGQIAFNPGYVLDALKASDATDVSLSFTNDVSPATFSLGFVYVLMPINK
jgi:DNA polymerase-3 subunit beta